MQAGAAYMMAECSSDWFLGQCERKTPVPMCCFMMLTCIYYYVGELCVHSEDMHITAGVLYNLCIIQQHIIKNTFILLVFVICCHDFLSLSVLQGVLIPN